MGITVHRHAGMSHTYPALLRISESRRGAARVHHSQPQLHASLSRCLVQLLRFFSSSASSRTYATRPSQSPRSGRIVVDIRVDDSSIRHTYKKENPAVTFPWKKRSPSRDALPPSTADYFTAPRRQRSSPPAVLVSLHDVGFIHAQAPDVHPPRDRSDDRTYYIWLDRFGD
jgi:hypothetical protein